MKILRLVDWQFAVAEFLILTIMDRFLNKFDFPCNERNIVIKSRTKIQKIKQLLLFYNWSSVGQGAICK